MKLEESKRSLSFAKFLLEKVEADFVYENVVHTRKLMGKLQELDIKLIVQDRALLSEIDSCERSLINIILRISKASITKEKIDGSMPCQYLGKVSFMDLYPELREYDDELIEEGTSQNQVEQLRLRAESLIKNWSKPFGMWIFDELPMIQTADGLMILSSGLMETLDLKEEEYYSIKIEEVVASSYKKAG